MSQKKKKGYPPKHQVWIDARQRFHLSHTHIAMAKELGLNPKKFGSLANHHQEKWKSPLPEFIEHLYFKHFKKERPDNVMSIEDMVDRQKQRSAERKERRAQEVDQEKAPEDPPESYESENCPF